MSEKLRDMEDWLRKYKLYLAVIPEIDLKNNARGKKAKQQDEFIQNLKIKRI